MIRIQDWACIASFSATFAVGAPAFATEAHYLCFDGNKLTAKFSPPNVATGEVKLTLQEGRTVILPQVLSADGGRYANGEVEFWIKGRSATLTMAGKVVRCTAQ
jgi:membrane-bound inhibitor of C-type lysozyme